MVHDESESRLQFEKQRVTDLPTCRRINIPNPRDEKTEVVLANIKARSLKATEEYITKYCDNRGNILDSNVSSDERKAMKSLSDRVNNGEIVIMATDKSGKLACESKQKYIESMEPHVKNDETLSLGMRNKIENSMNGHCLQLGRIIKMGYTHNHWDRIKAALVNKFGHIPVLYQTLF